MTRPQPRTQAMDRLVELMQTLRSPQGGCPWDIEQTFASIAPHTIEEAYEVADAIQLGDMPALKDELGDLLFQTVFHAQMASELKAFDFNDVVVGVTEKMIRRHPHVFGDTSIETADAQTVAWEDIKAAERAAKADNPEKTDESALAGVISGLPALKRAEKLQKRAARVGFDWPEAGRVIDKLREETEELQIEIDSNGSPERLQDELGDLLFVCVNLARKLGIDAETALRGANSKFEKRFRHMETALQGDQRQLKDMELDAMEAAWQATKKQLDTSE